MKKSRTKKVGFTGTNSRSYKAYKEVVDCKAPIMVGSNLKNLGLFSSSRHGFNFWVQQRKGEKALFPSRLPISQMWAELVSSRSRESRDKHGEFAPRSLFDRPQ